MCDTGNAAVGQPAATVSLRGMVNVVVSVDALAVGGALGHVRRRRPRCTGRAGRDAGHPARRRGNTTVEGLDNTRTWDGAPYPPEQFRGGRRRARRASQLLGDGTVSDMLWARPAVTILGIDCPPVVGSAAAIKPKARGPPEPPHPAGDRARTRPRERSSSTCAPPRRGGSHVSVEVGGDRAPRSRPPPTVRPTRPWREAMQEAYGTPMAHLGQGGSIPLCNVLAETYPDAEIILMGVEEPLALIHAPNESVDPREIEPWPSPRRSSCRATRRGADGVEEMTDRREVYEALDLALRIGEVLLSSGAGAADVTTTMLAVTHACGVRHVSADVTFVDLTLHHQPVDAEPAAVQVRRVTRRQVDYDDLIEVDETVNALIAGEITRGEARDRVARAVSTGHHRKRWAVTLGWGVMGTGVALTLGGNLVVCLLAFLAACAIDGTQLLLPQQRIPAFYQQAAGGFVATLIAVIASATPLDVNPSRVVTTGIVMLLAGVGIMGATQDALTGFPVTASARLIDATLNTVGIIAGVGAGLTVGDLLGVGPTAFEPGAAGLAEAGITVLGAALAAAGFAYASYAPLRSLVAVAIVAMMGQGVVLAVDRSEVGRTWGTTAAAITIGAVCYLVAGRFRVPPLVVVVPAIVPLLPGLDIYRGLALLAEGEDGVLELTSALATALALAAGVILGQYLARPLKREAHRLETRLSGPHMVGPFRRHS